MSDKKKNIISYTIFGIVFALVWIMLFEKCRYGYPTDETAYLLIPLRFINGDIPVRHEWHPTQFSFIWLQPLVYLYTKLSGGTEGIVLAFRYIYTFVWGIFSMFVFYRTRKFSHIGSMLATIFLLVYVPFNEMALYYNTIGLINIITACIIFLTAQKAKTVQYILSGMLLAIAITCCPYLLIPYLIFGVVQFVRLCAKKSHNFKNYMVVTSGAAIIFVVFAGYLLSRISLSEIVANIGHVFSDRGHQIPMAEKVITYFTFSLSSSVLSLLVYVIFAVTVVLVYYKNKKDENSREKNTRTGFIAVCVLAVILQISNLISNFDINMLVLSPSMLALYLRVFYSDADNRNIFKFICIPGYIYSVCLHFSSNVGVLSISSPMVIVSLGAILMTLRYLNNTKDKHSQNVVMAAFIVAIAFVLGTETFSRYYQVFCEPDRFQQTHTFEYGALRGIKMTEETYIHCKRNIEDTAILNEQKVGKVLVIDKDSWLYFYLDADMSTHSVFFLYVDDYSIDTLEEYYELNPEKRPDAIYVPGYFPDILPRVAGLGYEGSFTKNSGCILYENK